MLKISYRDEPACFEILSALQRGNSSIEWTVWIPRSPMLVMGRFSSIEEINPFAIDSDFKIYRRLGGGGTVFLDEGTVCLEFGVNLKKPVRKFEFVSSIKEIFVQFANLLNLPLQFSDEWYDLLYLDKKVGGSTLYFSGNIAIYGFSLIYSANTIEKIEELLQIPGKQPSYRKNRSHRDFLIALEKLVPMNILDVAIALCKSFVTFKENYLSPKVVSTSEDDKENTVRNLCCGSRGVVEWLKSEYQDLT